LEHPANVALEVVELVGGSHTRVPEFLTSLFDRTTAHQ